MGKTSAQVKTRYNLKAYDEIKVRVHKGNKTNLVTIAESMGETLNTFINKAIEDRIKRECSEGTYIFKYTENSEQAN